MNINDIKSKVSDVRTYWNKPPKGRYMNFKEIAAYAGGGIGAYFVIQLGSTLIVSATNMIVGGAIGIASMDMYVLYMVATLLNVPLTAIRADMVDNTRGKGGKYRPYLLSMGIPTALIAVAYVWFPYEKMYFLFQGNLFGHEKGYIIKCIMVMIFNLLLQFFFNFFNDAYTNLIHVLSPNTQERTDVLAIKSVVYSLAPSIMNLVLPLVAQFCANDNLYDIKVYRISYPVFAIIGIALTIVVYANTQEKIVQAKTHTIQVNFWDSLREVAKNKYFWIIALAGWLGFLESAYGNILTWSYTYGHTCNGAQLSLINTLTGNASLWGMLLAPFCIKRFGKKKVLIAVNFMNIVCILAMIIYMHSIWWLFVCVYFNWLFGAFEQITTPAIQADIRDYQQYRSGERIDGMFATVATIGNLVTLGTSAVLPAVYKHYGIVDGNGYSSPYDILDVKTGEPGLLYKLMSVLIIMAAVGAFLNVVPYFFYDFTEKKQKCVIRVLQIRALFEDFGNNALDNNKIVETIDLVNNAKEMAVATPKNVDKAIYKTSDKSVKKILKKEYKDAILFNEEIEIGQFVLDELNKFDSELGRLQVSLYQEIFNAGLDGIKNIDLDSAKAELSEAKMLPKETEEEKKLREFKIEFAKKKITSAKYFAKHFGTINEFVEPSMEELTSFFDKEDECEQKVFDLVKQKTEAKNSGDKSKVVELTAQIKEVQNEKKYCQSEQKRIQDEFARFNRAAKVYVDSRKVLNQAENYSHFEEIEAMYEQAKATLDAE